MAKDLWEAMKERQAPINQKLVTETVVAIAVTLGFVTLIMALVAVTGGIE